MIIEKDKAVSLDYTLTNSEGEILDSTQQQTPLVYLHGAGNILPRLEEALEGKKIKSRIKKTLVPEDGYGDYNPQLAQSYPLSKFPNADKLKVGTQFQVDTSGGPVLATITKIENEELTVDMNHPLAGQTLHFDIEVVDIREATEEELKHGHIHSGECGCSHE